MTVPPSPEAQAAFVAALAAGGTMPAAVRAAGFTGPKSSTYWVAAQYRAVPAVARALDEAGWKPKRSGARAAWLQNTDRRQTKHRQGPAQDPPELEDLVRAAWPAFRAGMRAYGEERVALREALREFRDAIWREALRRTAG